jgi:hypothetical protein
MAREITMNIVIKAAYDRVRKAERERDDLIKSTYLPGDVVSYFHGYHEITVTVREVSGERLRVMGGSGKPYWIGAYRL